MVASRIKYGKNEIMQWIFISPHFDDVALSCGGLIWELTNNGNEVEIWTICGGNPSIIIHSPIVETLHKRWKSSDQAAIIRRQEDIRSCQILNASYYHFDVLDCIYRLDKNHSPLYPTEESLFGSIHPQDEEMIEHLTPTLLQQIPKQAQLVCPLAIGNHVDHQLSRKIIEKTEKSHWLYADFPYVIRNQVDLNSISGKGLRIKRFAISEEGYRAWLMSVSAHHSQLSSFWKSKQEMDEEFRQYLQNNHGIPLWRSKQTR